MKKASRAIRKKINKMKKTNKTKRNKRRTRRQRGSGGCAGGSCSTNQPLVGVQNNLRKKAGTSSTNQSVKNPIFAVQNSIKEKAERDLQDITAELNEETLKLFTAEMNERKKLQELPQNSQGIPQILQKLAEIEQRKQEIEQEMERIESLTAKVRADNLIVQHSDNLQKLATMNPTDAFIMLNATIGRQLEEDGELTNREASYNIRIMHEALVLGAGPAERARLEAERARLTDIRNNINKLRITVEDLLVKNQEILQKLVTENPELPRLGVLPPPPPPPPRRRAAAALAAAAGGSTAAAEAPTAAEARAVARAAARAAFAAQLNSVNEETAIAGGAPLVYTTLNEARAAGALPPPPPPPPARKKGSAAPTAAAPTAAAPFILPQLPPQLAAPTAAAPTAAAPFILPQLPLQLAAATAATAATAAPPAPSLPPRLPTAAALRAQQVAAVKAKIEMQPCISLLEDMNISYNNNLANYRHILQYFYKMTLREDILLSTDHRTKLENTKAAYKNLFLNSYRRFFDRYGNNKLAKFKEYKECLKKYGIQPSLLEQISAQLEDAIDTEVKQIILTEKLTWDSTQKPPPSIASAGQQIMGGGVGWRPTPWTPNFDKDDKEVDEQSFDFLLSKY